VVTLRATQKVLRLLPATTADPDAPDTALGDWYVNRITCDRQPLLLLVSSTSLLPLLAPAREVRSLPERLAQLVAARLVRLGVPARLIEAETQAMAPVAVARTIDRSVVGTMVDFGRVLAYYLRGWAQDESVLWQAEARLARTPCRCSRAEELTVWPDRVAGRVLGEKWGGER
jgi:hypothetical protein